MRTNQMLGLVMANVHDDLMKELTEVRSMGSIPFGGRYRIIDFTLSNLVNAGVSKVGVVTRENYRSLMDHLGSGKPWDLDRKTGGLYILPPYLHTNTGALRGSIEALSAGLNFLTHSTEQYVVLCDANLISNLDLSAMLDKHIETGADVTLAYARGRLPRSHRDVMSFTFQSDRRIASVKLAQNLESECDFSLQIAVMARELLIRLITEAADNGYTSLSRDIFQQQVNTLRLFGYRFDGFLSVMDSVETYIRANRMLLDPEVRRQLFDTGRPVYTKTRDDMPTRYGLACKVADSIVADGCVIEGQVRNSILFRGVKVGAGAIVEDCIVMQDSVIEQDAQLRYVTLDKDVLFGARKTLRGSEFYPVVIRKGAVI